MRGNKKAYMHLCTNYMPCVVGKKNWDDQSRDEPMSEIADESDEAFLLLVIENSYLVWKQLAKYPKGTLPEGEAKRNLPLYTGTPAGSGRNEGWGDTGTKRFNALCRRVEKDRAEHGEQFDREYIAKRREECANGRKRKSMIDDDAVRKEAPYFNHKKLKKCTAKKVLARQEEKKENDSSDTSDSDNDTVSDTSLHAKVSEEV